MLVLPFTPTAGNSNENQIAAILDSLQFQTGGTTGDLATVLGVLNNLNSAQLQSALDQINPGATYMMPQLTYASQNAEFASLNQRFNAIGNGTANLASSNHFDYYDAQAKHPAEAVLADAGAPLTGVLRGNGSAPAETPWGFFGSGSGSFGNVNSMTGPSGSLPGYSFNSNGATFGVDYRFKDWLTLGLAGGDINTNSSLRHEQRHGQ